MPDDRFAALYDALPDWSALDQALLRNLRVHGDFGRWQAALNRLPQPGGAAWSSGRLPLAAGGLAESKGRTASEDAAAPAAGVRLNVGDWVAVDGELPAGERALLREALEALHPWRKGPFSLFGVRVESEWRSGLKWRRVAPVVELGGCRVLDVGCGNGYFGWRMLAAGAELVVGVDSSVLSHMQHQAVNHFVRSRRNWVLPLRFDDLPRELAKERFDAVFSMGVIYHQRSPWRHLERLRRCLKPGGQAVLESLVVEGRGALRPPGRYARMGNVRVIPTPGGLVDWLAQAGFREVRVVDVSATTADEQRTTSWMRFQSLADALDPANPSLTIEGHPAPRRCVVAARNLF